MPGRVERAQPSAACVAGAIPHSCRFLRRFRPFQMHQCQTLPLLDLASGGLRPWAGLRAVPAALEHVNRPIACQARPQSCHDPNQLFQMRRNHDPHAVSSLVDLRLSGLDETVRQDANEALVLALRPSIWPSLRAPCAQTLQTGSFRSTESWQLASVAGSSTGFAAACGGAGAQPASLQHTNTHRLVTCSPPRPCAEIRHLVASC